MRLIATLLLPFALASQVPFQAAPHTSLLPTDITDYIESLRLRWGVKGISLALVGPPNASLTENGWHGSEVSRDDDGWIRESVSFGQADRVGHSVESDTLFAIASNSKLFTAVAVGLLIENQTRLRDGSLLKWNTKIKDVLPEWKLQDQYASDHVDLLDLASMRSGMPRHDNSHSNMSPADVIYNLRSLRPSTELRQAWQYNNHHYLALSHIIPTLTNISFISFVQDNIFKPLGMDSTTYNSTVAAEGGKRSDGFVRVGRNMSRCYEVLGDNLQASTEQNVACLGEAASIDWWTTGDGTNESGMGGVVSSSSDLTKWLKELLKPSVISRSLLERLSTSLTVPLGRSSYPEESLMTYAMAQFQVSYRGHNTIGHTGSLPGHLSSIFRIPDKGFGIGIMVNDDTFGVEIHDIIKNRVMDYWLRLDYIDWETRLLGKKFDKPHQVKLPSHPEDPRGGWKGIGGRYFDKGYGSLELVEQNARTYRLKKHFVERQILELLETGGKSLNLNGPIYIAKVDKIFYSHLIFTHFDGVLFNVTSVRVYPSPASTTTFIDEPFLASLGGSGTAVIVNEGIGMFGDFWGKGPSVEGKEVVKDFPRVRDESEVWYDKVA